MAKRSLLRRKRAEPEDPERTEREEVQSEQSETQSQVKPTKPAHVKYFPDQFDDEEVLYVFRKHPVVMRKGLVWGSFGLLVGPLYTLVMTYMHPDTPPSINFFYLSVLASFGIGALLFFPDWMSWHYSVFVVTNQRFIQITQKGFFHRSVVDMGLNQIQMVNYEISGLQETLLGFGTIMMQTFVGDLVIHYLHHPQKIQKHILEILRDNGVQVSNTPQAASTETA